MNELLPCPFCDGEAKKDKHKNVYDTHIICTQCGGKSGDREHATDAVNLWNNRPIVLTRTSDDYKKGFRVAIDMIQRWSNQKDLTLDEFKAQIEAAVLFNKEMEEKGFK